MHDDKTEKCWVWFWRNGVRFQIFVDKADVQNTPFYEQWKPLLRQFEHGGEMSLSQWEEVQWHPLCDLLISTAMPTLRRLAPEGEYWTSLQDYLHTPAYRLRLAASDNRSEILTKVEEGPKDTGAYDLEPVSQDVLPQPPGIQLYRSQDLQVLNREKDWRRRPQKVSSSDGNAFFFLGCEKGSRNAGTQKMSNTSLDAIRAQLKLMETYRGATPPEGIPQVYGIVTDSSFPEDPSKTHAQEGTRVDGIADSEQRIAGILLSWIPQGISLSQTVKVLANLDEHEVETKIRAWTQRVGAALGYLHRNDVYFGGREDWRYLNQYTILIDAHLQPWLDISYVSWMADVSTEEAKAGEAADGLALTDLFEKWLPEEVAKARNA